MIGIMQGRLSSAIEGKIQAFPITSWQDEFFLAQEIGFDLIEWTLDRENILSNPLFTNHHQIISLMKEASVNVKSLTYDAAMQKPLITNKQINPTEIECLKETVIQCEKIGINYLILPLVDESSIKSCEEEFLYIDLLKSIGEEIKRSNVNICIESDFEPSKLKNFIELINCDNVRINYDTGNSANLGWDFEEEMKLYSDLILNIHIKDRLYKGETVPLGSGHANLSQKIKYFTFNYPKLSNIIQGARSKLVDDISLCKQYFHFVKSFKN